MSSAYIVDGRIERGADKSQFGVRTYFLHFFSWGRFLFIAVAVALLLATNPANVQLFQQRDLPTPKATFSSLFRIQEKGNTNYLFFSVKESPHALTFMFLGEHWSCRYDDLEIGAACEHLTSMMSHGKPVLWDPSDAVHTAHRIICWSLILSAAGSFCFPLAPAGRLFDNPFIDSLVSVFYRPYLLYDLFHANVAVFPALVELHRIVPLLRSDSTLSTGDHDLDFAFAAILLVMGIGGGSNWLAAQLLAKGDCVCGFSPVVAACLAYCQRIAIMGSPVLLLIDGFHPISTSDVYWAELVIMLLRGSRNSFPIAIAWLIGGFLGSALGKYHLENVAVWGSLFKFFGWS